MRLLFLLTLVCNLSGCIDPGTLAVFIKESAEEQGVQTTTRTYGDLNK